MFGEITYCPFCGEEDSACCCEDLRSDNIMGPCWWDEASYINYQMDTPYGVDPDGCDLFLPARFPDCYKYTNLPSMSIWGAIDFMDEIPF